MSRWGCRPNSSGYILVPVVMALTLIALLCYMLNRSSGIDLHAISSRGERVQAGYVAEAAVQHARWFLKTDCAYRAPITDEPFMGHSYSASLSDNADGTVRIVATGTLSSGVSLTAIDDYRCQEVVSTAVYWTDWQQPAVRRAELDGSGITDLVTALSGLFKPKPLKIDADAQKIYWAEPTRIRSSNLDGSAVQTLLDCGTCNITALALEPAGGKLYWADDNNQKISRANLDGTGIEALVTTGINQPAGLVLDAGKDEMYWVDKGLRTLKSAKLDGSNVNLEETFSFPPTALAIDTGAQKLFLFDPDTLSILRTQYGGGGRQNLVVVGGSAKVNAIDFDFGTGKMYWADEVNRKIERSNLDGSGREEVLVFASGKPWGVAIGPARPVAVPRSRGPYWAEEDKRLVRRSEMDGTNLQTVVSEQNNIESLRFDSVTEKLYWAYDNKFVGSSTPGGADVQNVIDCNALACNDLTCIALDPAGGKIYLADISNSEIYRANLDGSGFETLIPDNGTVDAPTDIELDLAAGRMYWSDEGTTTIKSALLDGSDIQTVLSDGAGDPVSKPYAIAIDPRGAGKLYWYNHGSKTIYRANIDGSGTETLFGPAGVNTIRRLALDLDENKLYWSDYDGRQIMRSNLDGSFSETLVTPSGKPWGLAIVPGS